MVICKEKAIKKKKASSTCLNVNRTRFTFDTILIRACLKKGGDCAKATK